MWNPIANWLIKPAKVMLYREFGAADFIQFQNEEEKLMYALHNPAFLKVASLQCDTFSLGKFRLFQNKEEVESHPILDLLNRPYFDTNTSEFLWEWMFNLMLGKSYVRTVGNLNSLTEPLLIPLETYKIQEPNEYQRLDFKTILTEDSYNDAKKVNYKYYSKSGQVFNIPADEIIVNNDISFEGASRIQALMKIIQNNEKSIDSQNINIKYAGKFLISGKNDRKDIHTLPMGQDEKNDIEQKSISRKPVEAVKSMIDIKRYVSDKMFNELSDAYQNSYFTIGNMYNIPRDVLESFKSSTFENQEQARGAHVAYTLMPHAKNLCSSILNHFGLNDFDLRLEYDHLPFMQVFEHERMKRKSTTIDAFSKMRTAGIPIEQVNEFLGTDFDVND